MKIYQLEAQVENGLWNTVDIYATLDDAKKLNNGKIQPPWRFVESLMQWEQQIGGTHYVITERELRGSPDLTQDSQVRELMTSALSVFDSVSEKNFKALRQPSGKWNHRLVSPQSLIKLADALDGLREGLLEHYYEIRRRKD
jgi:hypothetical protein